MGFLVLSLTFSVYTKNKPAQLAYADSLIAEAPKAMRGNFLDALLHAFLGEAYAAKGDRQRSLDEGTADEVITLERIGDFLMNGPRGDRTRQMLARALRPRPPSAPSAASRSRS